MIFEINIFIIALVALFLLFMKLSRERVKFYLKVAAAFFALPLLITLITSSVRGIEADFVSVLLLQGGITSILFSVGYGVCVGLLFNGFKLLAFEAFYRTRQFFAKAQAGDNEPHGS